MSNKQIHNDRGILREWFETELKNVHNMKLNTFGGARHCKVQTKNRNKKPYDPGCYISQDVPLSDDNADNTYDLTVNTCVPTTCCLL